MGEYSLTEMAKECRREAGLRRHVYPRWVAQGRMKQDAADRQIAIMDEMAEHFAECARLEAATEQPSLL